MFHPAKGMHFTIPMVAYNGAGRLCALFQRQSTNLVSIGKAGFFPAHRADANALVDIVRTIFNDAVFKNPGLVIARLKIEIAVIQTALGQLAKNGKQILMIQAMRLDRKSVV